MYFIVYAAFVCIKLMMMMIGRRFTVTIKQIKRSDMVTFSFSVHTITEASNTQG